MEISFGAFLPLLAVGILLFLVIYVTFFVIMSKSKNNPNLTNQDIDDVFGENGYYGAKRTKKRLKMVAITILCIFLAFILYFYPQEQKKLNSPSRTSCGEFIKIYNSSDGKSNGNVTYITINFSFGERNLLLSGNLAKSITEEYKHNNAFAKTLKQGDKVCATYSKTYIENLSSKIKKKQIPYLIRLSK